MEIWKYFVQINLNRRDKIIFKKKNRMTTKIFEKMNLWVNFYYV
jgi:hypothetical protein